MKIKCHKIEKIMGLYLFNELAEQKRAAFEGHLQTCPVCSAQWAQFRQTQAFISAAQAPMPSPDWDRSWQVIRKNLVEHRERQQGRERVIVPALRWAGVLVGGVVIFLLGLWAGARVKGTVAGSKAPGAIVSPYIAREFQEHMENLKPVILEYANYWRSAGRPLDLPVAKEQVIRLLVQNQQLLCQIPGENNRDMQQLLNELNVILTKIAMITWDDPDSLSAVKKMIRQKGLLFKMEALRPLAEAGLAL
jgi:hypothetical protein